MPKSQFRFDVALSINGFFEDDKMMLTEGDVEMSTAEHMDKSKYIRDDDGGLTKEGYVMMSTACIQGIVMAIRGCAQDYGADEETYMQWVFDEIKHITYRRSSTVTTNSEKR